jgi:hypothetical protein
MKGGHIIEDWGWFVGCLITKESHPHNKLQPLVRIPFQVIDLM